MQILEKTRNVQTAGIGQVHKATITASAKVFSFFSDQTYTDKPRTIIREYTANGVDEHNQCGRPKMRMVITLPTEANPVLSFRDFGRGMSHLFITTSFMAYADGSTKTADNVAIGGLGIGSKSGFAYTDQFVIRSIHEGMSRTYSMFKDEEGVPGIALLDEQPTDEPSGCEIMIPIDAPDFDKFREAAEEVLGYFDPQPELVGGAIQQPNYVATGEGWAVRKKEGDLAVIMGGVRYPVSKSSLPYDVRQDPLIEYGIDLTMPIGSCSVALSREALSMDDPTKVAIIEALKGCRDSIIASFANMFDGYASKWEASKALGDMQQGNTARYRLLSSHARYKGEELPVHYRAVGVDISAHNQANRRSTISRFEWCTNANIQPSRVNHLIIDDLPDNHQKRLLARVKHGYGHQLAWRRDILVATGGTVEQMLAALGGPTDYVLASSLPLPPPKPRVTGTRVAQRVFRASMRGYYGKSELVELTDLTGRDILVEMDNFDVPSGFYNQWQMKVVDKDRVVFANKTGAKGLKHLTPWSVAFATAREELLGKVDLANVGHIKWVKQNNDLHGYFNDIGRIRVSLGELTPAQQSRPFGKLVDLYDRYFSVSNPEGYELVEAKRPPRLDVDRLLKAFEEQQPKAAYLLDEVTHHTKEVHVDLLKDNI
jgi:hypothetical protein